MTPKSEIMFGSKAADNQTVNLKEDDLRIQNEERRWFSLRRADLSTGLLCIGGTGSGKTNAIRLLMHQLKRGMKPQDVMIVFDTKGDFYRDFFRSGTDCVLAAEESGWQNCMNWNIFQELATDGTVEQQNMTAREMARSLFHPYESAQQPFFTNAARGIFTGYLQTMLRISRENSGFRQNLYNENLADYFGNITTENLENLASEPGMGFIRSYLGDGENDQAQGVLSELQVMVQDCFFGAFSRKGNFSVRDFVRSAGGKTLFVEYSPAIGDVLSPVYSLLIDMALKEALSRAEDQAGNVYIVLDELKLLPHIRHLDDAVNFGRSKGIHVIASLQAISQLYDVYGEHKAQSTIAGFGSLLAFRPNDARTREFVSEFFGKCMTVDTVFQNMTPVSERRSGFCVEDWELRQMSAGSAFVSIIGRQPYFYSFPMYVKG